MGTANVAHQLAQTAHHEAGHAIAFLYLYLRFKYVTIERGADGTRGHLISSRWRWATPPQGALQFEVSSKDRHRAERHILALYAGQLAQAKFYPRSSWRTDSGEDNWAILQLFSRICDTDQRCQRLYAKLLWHRAEVLVNTCWTEIQAVAGELLKRKRLNYDEVLEVGGIARLHGSGPRASTYHAPVALVTGNRRGAASRAN
jgi:hypothetical protein